MSIALIGIGITQFVWIKAQVDLDEQNFDDKVIRVMGNVKQLLQEDTETQEFITGFYKDKKKKSLFGQKEFTNLLSASNKNYHTYSSELAGMMQVLDPNELLESINKENLDSYIKDELNDQGIDLKYDYGVFSNLYNDFLIRNGSFAAQVSDKSSSQMSADKGLYDSQYKVQLFNDEEGSPGFLKVYFPGKSSWLWAKVIPSMLISLLFTGLILMSFLYTVYVIFRQKQVSEMKSDFINNMTHEFKTPIATISLATDSITNSTVIGSPDKIKRFASIIKQENKRMLSQVEKVLQMARLDKSEFELKIVALNINDLVTQAAGNSRLKVVSRDGELTTALNATSAIIEGDQTHISNIIHNLLDNAEKYSADQPKIHISTENAKKGVKIIIKDNGIGMTKESLKHIFDKFYRVHTGNRHDVKGFGLGLSYVKALVSAHKGTISVESELNKGSTFSVFLPKLQEV